MAGAVVGERDPVVLAEREQGRAAADREDLQRVIGLHVEAVVARPVGGVEDALPRAGPVGVEREDDVDRVGSAAQQRGGVQFQPRLLVHG